MRPYRKRLDRQQKRWLNSRGDQAEGRICIKPVSREFTLSKFTSKVSGRYDNPLPELTLSLQSGSMNSATGLGKLPLPTHSPLPLPSPISQQCPTHVQIDDFFICLLILLLPCRPCISLYLPLCTLPYAKLYISPIYYKHWRVSLLRTVHIQIGN
jgi:hypothetical protein